MIGIRISNRKGEEERKSDKRMRKVNALPVYSRMEKAHMHTYNLNIFLRGSGKPVDRSRLMLAALRRVKETHTYIHCQLGRLPPFSIKILVFLLIILSCSSSALPSKPRMSCNRIAIVIPERNSTGSSATTSGGLLYQRPQPRTGASHRRWLIHWLIGSLIHRLVAS